MLSIHGNATLTLCDIMIIKLKFNLIKTANILIECQSHSISEKHVGGIYSKSLNH